MTDDGKGVGGVKVRGVVVVEAHQPLGSANPHLQQHTTSRHSWSLVRFSCLRFRGWTAELVLTRAR